jgi:hypothetical protein
VAASAPLTVPLLDLKAQSASMREEIRVVVGTPARQKGWMSRHGHARKPDAEGRLRCPESGSRYQLPAELSVGSTRYDEFKGRVR